jgi:hypothetical protein
MPNPSSIAMEDDWAEPQRAVEVVTEGDPRFDAAVDALIGAFHMNEAYACRVVTVVAEAFK